MDPGYGSAGGYYHQHHHSGPSNTTFGSGQVDHPYDTDRPRVSKGYKRPSDEPTSAERRKVQRANSPARGRDDSGGSETGPRRAAQACLRVSSAFLPTDGLEADGNPSAESRN